jgi:hypothetical protein
VNEKSQDVCFFAENIISNIKCSFRLVHVSILILDKFQGISEFGTAVVSTFLSPTVRPSGSGVA